jgi:hypothetical protein
MENKKFWLGMLTVALVFGMTVVGCDDDSADDDYDDRPFLHGPIGLDNYYPVVGETITAGFGLGYYGDIDEPKGTSSYTWYKTNEDRLSLYQVTNKSSIGYGNTYTVQQSDVGFWIWVEVSYSGYQGTADTKTYSTVIGIPAAATVSVSIRAVYYPSYSASENYRVTVTLTLSDGRWNDITGRWEGSTWLSPYNIASQWISISGTPSVSSWYTGYSTPPVYAWGRELVFSYMTRSDTPLSISNLTATLNTAQLGTMRNSTNVYNTLTAGVSTASVSQWTISQ